MEAPERIYIHVKNGKVRNTWNSEWIGVNDIEYTRTDAFIEKVCKYLRENCTYIHPRKGTKECFVNLTLLKDFLNRE
jgi:hypothetical protein